MTCKALRLINIRDDFDYPGLRERFQRDIASWNSKFDEQEFIEVVFHSPGHLRYFCECIQGQVDFQLTLEAKQAVPFDLFALYAPNLAIEEILQLRRTYRSLTCVRPLPLKPMHTRPSYIVEFSNRGDADRAAREFEKLRVADFQYRISPYNSVSWGLFVEQNKPALVLRGLKPEIVCRIVGIRSMAHESNELILQEGDLGAMKRKLDDYIESAAEVEIALVQNVSDFLRECAFREEHAPLLKAYKRFAECRKGNALDMLVNAINTL